MDDRTQVIQQRKVLAPAHVDDREQHLLLNGAQPLGAEHRRFLRVGLIDRARHAFDDFLLGDALFCGPLIDR